MRSFLRKVPDSLVRITVVFAVLAGLVFLLRLVLPASMKDAEHHVRSTVEREVAKPVRHAGSEVCGECHEEAALAKVGFHRTLSCETCHGPAKQHVDDPGTTKPALPRMREFCARCHTYDASRPTGFPQINPAVHNPLKTCVTCHNPHDPKPSAVPHECQACHAEIARTKALSAHVQIECSSCHTVPQGHRTSPRSIGASIPQDRGFCGTCHDRNAARRDTPKVDLATHGEKYLCWQCHYPHMPEVE